MSGIVELEKLLRSLSPRLSETKYVCCTFQGNPACENLEPLATFREDEGLSWLLLEKGQYRLHHFRKYFQLDNTESTLQPGSGWTNSSSCK